MIGYKINDIQTFGPDWKLLYDYDKNIQSFIDFYNHEFDDENKEGSLLRFLIKKG